MMQTNRATTLEQARRLTRHAGQWLDLLNFRAHDAAPMFSNSMTTYCDMLDPEASDAARLSACRAMLRHVRRRLEVERLEGEAIYARNRPPDPYGLHWQITPHGATLDAIARLLSDAVAIFEAALDEAAE